ncbi:Cytochrome c-551 precursor [compost metagenome]
MRLHPLRNHALQITAAAGLLLVLTGCGEGKNELNGPTKTMAVYKANCVSCHGSELQGRVGPNTNLQKVGARMSAADITEQIEQGEGSMPAFKDRLTEEEIGALAEWLSGKK